MTGAGKAAADLFLIIHEKSIVIKKSAITVRQKLDSLHEQRLDAQVQNF